MNKHIGFALFLAISLQTVNFQPTPLVFAQEKSPQTIDKESLQTMTDKIDATSINLDFNEKADQPLKIMVKITAYSSTPDQTDSTPFITASGKRVNDGIIAANFLKFGTKVKIPELFGDKIFVVEDRMAPRYFHRIDVWFSDTKMARRFGLQEAEIIIL